MAYMSQEHKKELAPAIKAVCKKYGVKATLAVRHHSGLVLNVSESHIDFIGNFNETDRTEWKETKSYHDVNTYWYKEHYTGEALAFLSEVIELMNVGNFDKSDAMTDYFHVGWYTYVNIGKWNKPYKLIEAKKAA